MDAVRAVIIYWTLVDALVVCVALKTAATEVPSIGEIFVATDYHSARVSWRYPNTPLVHVFAVQHCELNSWSPQCCHTQIVLANKFVTSANDDKLLEDRLNSQLPVQYNAYVEPLKMDTNYRFRVVPLHKQQSDHKTPEAIEVAAEVLAKTKEFSAVTRCKAGRMEVQVRTGRNFAGRLAVENDPLPSCQLQGQPSSSRQLYTLVVDQSRCRTQQLGSQVRAFVVVQERDHLQTHSTRRFLVVCDYNSHTLTVGAGVRLPHRVRQKSSLARVEALRQPLAEEFTERQIPMSDGRMRAEKNDSTGVSANLNKINTAELINALLGDDKIESTHKKSVHASGTNKTGTDNRMENEGIGSNTQVDLTNNRTADNASKTEEVGQNYITHGRLDDSSNRKGRTISDVVVLANRTKETGKQVQASMNNSNNHSSSDTYNNQGIENIIASDSQKLDVRNIVDKRVTNSSSSKSKGRSPLTDQLDWSSISQSNVSLRSPALKHPISVKQRRIKTPLYENAALAEKLVSDQRSHKNKAPRRDDGEAGTNWKLIVLMATVCGGTTVAAVSAAVVMLNWQRHRRNSRSSIYNVTNHQPVNHIIVRGEYPGTNC